MDKNGIGTDATMAEHIKKIQERNYASKVLLARVVMDKYDLIELITNFMIGHISSR